MGFLQWLWNGIKALPGLLLPLFASPGERPHMRPWLRWTLHGVMLVSVLALLAYLNYVFDLEMVLQTPWSFLRKAWLPLLFFLIYLLAWLGWWLWQLLQPDQTASLFPDIDAAWKEALASLDRAGIDLTEAPLFLVLGKPAGTEESLFAAAQLPLQVRHEPRAAEAPIHIYASRQGIFVTCPGASLLGRQSSLFAGTSEDGGERVTEAEAGTAGKASLAGVSGALRGEDMGVGKGTLGTMPPLRQLLRNSDEEEMLTARLQYLCGLIATRRRPFCPVNGMLVLLPWASMNGDAETKQTARLCQRELETVQETLQVQCPLVAVVCDLEQVAGFREAVARLPEKQRHLRLGLHFPLLPDLEAARVPRMIEGAVAWICETQYPTLVYNLLRLAPEGVDRSEILQGNIRLYQAMADLRERRGRLASLLTRGLSRPSLLLGGCFLASTGPDPAREQAFATGVFPLLIQYQNYVSWTAEPLAEEATYRRWTVAGYAGLGALSLLLAAMVLWM